MCTEIAIFKVPKENITTVLALSASIIDEINATSKLVTSHHILQKIDNDEEICWFLTWVNEDAVKLTASKWTSFPSARTLDSLVSTKVYYGHFVSLF
jgi:hypothetical protein